MGSKQIIVISIFLRNFGQKSTRPGETSPYCDQTASEVLESVNSSTKSGGMATGMPAPSSP
jgi:hypothetical protein